MTHRAFRVLLAATLALACASGASGSPADPLWLKAVQVTRASVGWMPGSATFLIQLVDDQGSVQDSWQSWFTMAPGNDGSVTMDVVKAQHNGEDTTAREQENQKKTRRPPPTHWDNPFDPAVQETVTATPEGKTELVEGRTCALYDFTFRKSDKLTLSGTAWIDASSGAPMQARYTTLPLPRGVYSLTTTMKFSRGPAGDGFLQAVTVEGAGGLLFVKKNFRSAITVGDYWKRSTS